MARTHARIQTAIWADPDFRALSADAQHLYLVLLSSPKLTMIGSLDLVPQRWAQLADTWNLAAVEGALAELEGRGYILVDSEHAELVIRTFVRNDGVATSWQLVKAMWSAWSALSSPELRVAILDHLPPEAWTYQRAAPPSDALSHGACDAPSDPPTDDDPELLKPEALPLKPEEPPPAAPTKPEPSVALAVVKPPARPFDDDFVEWWKGWPKKLDRQQAYGTYVARRRQGIDHTRLMAAAGHYVATVEQRWMKHGSTFLAKDGPWTEWEHGPPAAVRASAKAGPVTAAGVRDLSARLRGHRDVIDVEAR